MAGLANSDNEFDKWFAGQVKEVHGIDVEHAPRVRSQRSFSKSTLSSATDRLGPERLGWSRNNALLRQLELPGTRRRSGLEDRPTLRLGNRRK